MPALEGESKGLSTLGLATDDFNGVTSNWLSNGTVTILLGNGDGTFQPPQSYPVGSTPDLIATADFNGDQFPDLAVACAQDGRLVVLMRNGDGTFAPATRYALGTQLFGVVAVDLDNSTDIVVSDLVGALVTLLDNGDGTFRPPLSTPLTVGSNAQAVVTGDFNGDGRPDLVTVNGITDTVQVLLGNGDGTFTPPSPSCSAAPPSIPRTSRWATPTSTVGPISGPARRATPLLS
jgi:hypothetical protein